MKLIKFDTLYLLKLLFLSALVADSMFGVYAVPGDIDKDDLIDTVESCNGNFISGIRSGTCDSHSLCNSHRSCVQTLGEACSCDGSSGGPAPGCSDSGISVCNPATDSTCLIACATTLDFDCDSRTDAQEDVDGTDPTDPSDHIGGITPIDTDGDGVGNSNSSGNCDPDDDNDGLLDIHEDLNGNNIVDPGETDPLKADTDGDGVNDKLDKCPTGLTGWTSNTENDKDADGCPDDLPPPGSQSPPKPPGNIR